jgi:hypothetical protein
VEQPPYAARSMSGSTRRESSTSVGLYIQAWSSGAGGAGQEAPRLVFMLPRRLCLDPRRELRLGERSERGARGRTCAMAS